MWPMSHASRAVSSTHSTLYNIIFPLGLLLPETSQFLLRILTLTLMKSFAVLMCFLFVITQKTEVAITMN